jgi:hypothetical protein
MNAALQTKAKAPTQASFTPVRADLLQGKCGCGGSAGMTGECEECGNKKLNLQRSVANRAEASTAPRAAHEAQHPPGQTHEAAPRPFIESRFGHDFGRVSVLGERTKATLQKPVPVEKQPEPREPHAQESAQSTEDQMQLDLEVEVIRPPASSQLTAALSTGGEAVDEESEDILTAQGGGPPLGPGPLAPPSCTYTITYDNVRDAPCAGGRCGRMIIYDITSVTATGSGCPADLNGLMLTESVTNNHGCSPANVQTGAGCPLVSHAPMMPTYAILENCTDTYAVCLGTTSQARIPAGGCTEIYTQQLFIGGVLAETHIITFTLTKSGTSCSGTVNRT